MATTTTTIGTAIIISEFGLLAVVGCEVVAGQILNSKILMEINMNHLTNL